MLRRPTRPAGHPGPSIVLGMARIVTAVYYDSHAAEAALAALAEAGVDRSAVIREATEFAAPDETGLLSATGAPTTALRGVAVGGVLGAVVGSLMHFGVVPGGALLGGWWISALARGILAGAGLGLIIGFVLGLGMWEAEDDPVTTQGVRAATLLSVSDPALMATAREVFWKNGADQISG